MTTKMMLTTIPFGGFYDSLHSGAVDDVEERMFTDENGNDCAWSDDLRSRVTNRANYKAIYTEYAKDYCERFGCWLKIDSLKFDEMKSPRFYNFETDRIFAYLSKADAIKLHNSVPYDALVAKAKERFTSRDGFASFYDPDITTWGPVETWDHNQIGTIMEVAAVEEHGSEFDSWAERDLVNDESISSWIDKNTPDIERLYRVHEYLEKRSKREEETA
jgi:hypothetical protein